jgi:hypothetical protein
VTIDRNHHPRITPMTTTATTNGKPQRKPLADQIDRLDDILDGLADALNGAVADAAREGARLAVKEAIFEVLTNPELRGLIARPQTAAPPAATNPIPVLVPSVWTRLKTRLAALRARAAEAVKPAVEAAAAKCRAAKPVVATAKSVVALAWRFKRVALTGLGVGLVTTAASYLAPHPVSAALTGVGGTLSALAVQGGLWVRATAKKLHLL